MPDLPNPSSAPPTNGASVLLRLRRLLFVGLASLLAVGALITALANRWVMLGILGAPLPLLHLPGPAWLWLSAGGVALLSYLALLPRSANPRLSLGRALLLTLTCLAAAKFAEDWRWPGALVACVSLLCLHLLVVRWRVRQPAQPRREGLLSLEAAVPLLALSVISAAVVTEQRWPAPAVAIACLLVALLVVFFRLPRLPFFATWAALAMALSAAFQLAQPALAAVVVFDLPPQLPPMLGHPPAGGIAEALPTDAGGLALTDRLVVDAITGVPVPASASAAGAAYAAGPLSGRLYIVEFSGVAEANTFFEDWRDAWSDELAYEIHLDLQNTPLAAGQVSRAYDVLDEAAHSAWVTDRWVIIAESQGNPIEALTVVRELRRAAVARFANP
jgi:hypothetical protein